METLNIEILNISKLAFIVAAIVIPSFFELNNIFDVHGQEWNTGQRFSALTLSY